MNMNIQDFINIRTERRLLQQIFWECTLRCNLNCLHCGSDCRKDDMPRDMPFEDFSKVLDEVAAEKDPTKIMIVTTGGEPLMRHDIVACGREITRRGFAWGMVTNGMLLDKSKLQELIDAGLKSISISLDGLQSEHNWMRGNEQSFQRAVRAIEALKESSLTWDVITCVNTRNFYTLGSFLGFLRLLGVKKWRIFTVFPMGRASGNQELQLSSSQFRQLMEFIKHVRYKKRIALSYSCEGYLGPYEMIVRDFPFFCGAGINIASVRYDGAITGCLSIRSNHDQGNIYTDNFMEVWNNRFEPFRNREWMKHGACLDCKAWKVCRGGAMHLREETGNMLGCSFLKLQEE